MDERLVKIVENALNAGYLVSEDVQAVIDAASGHAGCLVWRVVHTVAHGDDGGDRGASAESSRCESSPDRPIPMGRRPVPGGDEGDGGDDPLSNVPPRAQEQDLTGEEHHHQVLRHHREEVEEGEL